MKKQVLTAAVLATLGVVAPIAVHHHRHITSTQWHGGIQMVHMHITAASGHQVKLRWIDARRIDLPFTTNAGQAEYFRTDVEL